MKLFKFLKISNGQTEDIKAYETWVVRWRIRKGEHWYEPKEQIEVFTLQEDAQKFCKQLSEAFKLLKQSGGTCITCEKN